VKELLEGIQVMFDGSGTVAGELTGGCWPSYAAQGKTLPYMTVDVGQSTVLETMGTGSHPIEIIPVTMSLWIGVKTDETNQMALGTILGYRKDVEILFDDCAMTITGYHLLRFGRTGHGYEAVGDQGWRATITYSVMLEET